MLFDQEVNFAKRNPYIATLRIDVDGVDVGLTTLHKKRIQYASPLGVTLKDVSGYHYLVIEHASQTTYIYLSRQTIRRLQTQLTQALERAV